MRLSDSSHLTSEMRRNSRRPVLAGIILVLLGIACLADWSLADVDASFHLYYVPILLAAATLSKRDALGIAALAIVLAHLTDPDLAHLRYERVDVMDLLLVLIVAVVASRLSRDAEVLRRLASTDDLTGLHNLRSFEAISRDLIERQRLSKGRVAMLSLDLDRLKQLNDTYGHFAGADAVKHVGEVIARVLSGDAYACRYGGDEFAVIVAEDSDRTSTELAGRIRQAVAASAPVLDTKPFPVGSLSVSIGSSGATIDAGVPTAAIFAQLFRQADEAMYADKRARRPAAAAAPRSTSQLAVRSAGAEREPLALLPRLVAKA